MATWVGATPPVTKRKGGRGSSSKLARLTVVSTVLARGSITASVFESSLQMNTRSSACTPVGVPGGLGGGELCFQAGQSRSRGAGLEKRSAGEGHRATSLMKPERRGSDLEQSGLCRGLCRGLSVPDRDVAGSAC